MTAGICATGVTVEIGGRALLDGVDVHVEAGELHVLLGPNGAGKSTLLAALSGDLPLVRGAVEVCGRAVVGRRALELARERAVLTQEHGVAFSFPVRDVVRMGRAPWARTPREDDDDAVVARTISSVELDDFVDRAVPTLSGGERARTALARTLAQETPVLLLDEPTAALDLRHQEQALGLARAVADAGGAVLVVLHDLTLAAAYADTVTLLESGRIVATGSPRSVLTADTLTAVYAHPIEVFDHPTSGALLVQPARSLPAVSKEPA